MQYNILRLYWCELRFVLCDGDNDVEHNMTIDVGGVGGCDSENEEIHSSYNVCEVRLRELRQRKKDNTQ
jgi:hypothetical protein